MPKPAPDTRPRASKPPNGNGKKGGRAASAPDLASKDVAPDRGWLLVALVFFGGLSSLAVEISAGPLVAILLLFALPIILLGCVSPFAIRLRVQAVGSAGRTAGRLYALSTMGSLLGTFLPVFWLMPSYGVHATLLIVAGCLMAISAAGLILERFRVAVVS